MNTAFLRNKFNLILIGILLLLIIGGIFGYKKFVSAKTSNATSTEEQDLSFDPEGPYAVLTPRKDGNAMNVNIKRVASYDSISYELAYTSEGIDRGVVGTINTADKKPEYDQEVLFGTCSKNVCKYDTGVENGTLVLHIKKGSEAYRMTTQWHLQRADSADGKLSSGDSHFVYTIGNVAALTPSAAPSVKPKATPKPTAKASTSGNETADTQAEGAFSVVNDLTGAPKLPSGKTILGKVYAISFPTTRVLPAGTIHMELAETPNANTKIARFDENKNAWVELDSKINGSNLDASTDAGGIFTVFTSK
jgi:hypothetical protein